MFLGVQALLLWVMMPVVRTAFEVRQVARLLETNPRRIEGWVEHGILRPAIRGRGTGRRSLFSPANVLEGALVLEIQAALGERSPVVGPTLRSVRQTLGKEKLDFLIEEATVLERAMAGAVLILYIEIRRQHAPEVRLVHFVDPPALAELHTPMADALRAGHSILLINLGRAIDQLWRRIAEASQ